MRVRAVIFEQYGEPPAVRDVPDPVASERGVIVRVESTGLCRSDIHGWLGHDDGIVLPHVPGHELVGRVESVGADVHRFSVGDRVTTPFVCACGHCPECASGNGQVCRNQTQPGFTHWGSFAELVALHDADVNLIRLPDGVDPGAAALLGCRFATAYRGIVQLGRVAAGETVLIVGCGGVGLSAVMITVARGARVIAVDIDQTALERAGRLGAEATVDIRGLTPADALAVVGEAAGAGGVQVSVDALGRGESIDLAVRSLARRGRHVQIGLLAAEPVVPMTVVIAKELSLLGAHGLAATDYPALLELVTSGALRPERIVDRRIPLDAVPQAMSDLAAGRLPGVTVIDVV